MCVAPLVPEEALTSQSSLSIENAVLLNVFSDVIKMQMTMQSVSISKVL